MNICLVGHYAAELDNKGDLGTKHVGRQIAKRLSERHETIELSIREPLSWRQAKAFEPQIIHFVLSPSMLGLLAAKICAVYCGGPKTVLSAPNPNLSFPKLGVFFKPDVVLVQSCESENMFRSVGCDIRFLPNGVDLERFLPASPAKKVELKEKYGIGRDSFVILHVGPIIRRRNVEFLTKLQDADHQVIIIGRMPADRRVHQALRDAGCMVLTDCVEQIEEIYALSDCYVFPTPPANTEASIEMPLSVLEAMSCNLPIITTRFGALPRIFEEGEGLIFADSEDDLIQEMHRVKQGLEVRTRDGVLPYSWTRVVEELDSVYGQLVAC